MAQLLETLRGNNVTPLFGRRIGLQRDESLAGPIDLKKAIEDIQTTVATTLLAYGVSRILTSGSSQGPTQHFLPAPIPGVSKWIVMDSTSTGSQQFLSTANGASILAASDGTTKSVINFTGQGGAVHLMGLTTAKWAVMHGMNVGSTNVVAQVTYTTST